MPPGYLVPGSFLGRSLAGGVNPAMLVALAAAEGSLALQFSALPPDQQVDPNTGQPVATVAGWAGLREAHGTWRPHASFHSSGSAIDIDTSRNPYIATRTFGPMGAVFGGERPSAAHPLTAAQLNAVRSAATAVYDRAIQFFQTPLATADVGNRRPAEPTSGCYDRFSLVSELLGSYLSFACRTDLDRITRAPIPSPETATTTTLDGIPGIERRDKAAGVSDLTSFMSTIEFTVTHPFWPLSAEQQYYRMLKDYELVRLPMAFGPPSMSPASTRNPTRGFLSLRREVVVTLCDVGHMRWGACDFGAASGDVMHFDLGTHAGFTPQDF